MSDETAVPPLEPAVIRGSGSRLIVILAALGSILWLGAGIFGLGLLARVPKECEGTFSCMTIEGWGTYLAGIFAPVAFFWLVAAVL